MKKRPLRSQISPLGRLISEGVPNLFMFFKVMYEKKCKRRALKSIMLPFKN